MLKNLIVPFEHKDFAKSFGCRWNSDKKVWQIDECKYVIWHRAYALYKEKNMIEKKTGSLMDTVELNNKIDNLRTKANKEASKDFDTMEYLLKSYSDSCISNEQEQLLYKLLNEYEPNHYILYQPSHK